MPQSFSKIKSKIFRLAEIKRKIMIGSRFILSLFNVNLGIIAEESQFEQSVFFNKNIKKKGT